MKGKKVNEYAINTLDRVADAIQLDSDRLGTCFYVARNRCILGDYCGATLRRILSNKNTQIYIDVEGASENEIFDGYLEEAAEVATDISVLTRNISCIFTVNCLDERYKEITNQEKVAENLKKCCAQFGKQGIIVCYFIVPQPERCPEGKARLGEREYDYYLLTKEHTWQEHFYLKLERIIRESCINDEKHIILLRSTNIMGAGCEGLVQGLDIIGLLEELKTEKKISIKNGDNGHYFSYTSIFDAVFACLVSIIKSNELYCREYNVISDTVSTIDIKYALQKGFRTSISLITERIEPCKEVFHDLSGLRWNAVIFDYKIEQESLEEVLYQEACCYVGKTYDINRRLCDYGGRLPIIREMEMNILKVINQICTENNIQYFLAGGSVLGAVRHHDMIPWDDDIDIGMLREDYEKFRKIVPKKLPKGLTYEAANGESGSHYHFDKIRLKGTYFSTKYSANFTIPDGVFIDVLVYDQTSNIPLFQKLQIRLTAMWTRVINIKWVNKPRKTVYYKMSIVALPVMRLISWNWFHRVFDLIVRHYEHKKNAIYVIDSMGLNIKKGVLKKEWMTQVTMLPFGDMMAPVPKDYDSYCKHFYGQNYMEILSIDRRISGHNIARLDLGEYLFEDEGKKSVARSLDIRGELLEEEIL